MGGDKLPLELREAFARVCSLWFRGEESHRLCVEILEEVATRGWTDAGWGHGMKYYVATRLREIGLLEKRRTPTCGGDKIKTIYAADRKRLPILRMALEYLDRAPPFCV